MASKEAEGQIISQYVKGLKKRNSSAVPIHKLPECTDWLTNIRAFRQLISCTILSEGIFLTICVIRANEKSGEHGEVSSFAALCTALSATIGTGNIVGVATALVAGGPEALLWMWIAALLGTATKYSECLLAVKYRVVAEDGHIIGGPFYYIEKGMGEKWKWLAKIFAFFGVGVGLFGIGTFTQVNGITSAVKNFFDPSSFRYISL